MKYVLSLDRNSRPVVILLASILMIIWGGAAMAMTLNSPAFKQNGHIPSKYTCEGDNVSPPLGWEDVPNGTKSLVLIIDDPDAARSESTQDGLGTLGRLQHAPQYEELARERGQGRFAPRHRAWAQ